MAMRQALCFLNAGQPLSIMAVIGGFSVAVCAGLYTTFMSRQQPQDSSSLSAILQRPNRSGGGRRCRVMELW